MSWTSVDYEEGSHRVEDDLYWENLVSDSLCTGLQEQIMKSERGSHRVEDDLYWENLVCDSLCKGLQEQIMKSEREAVKTLPEELVEKILALLPYPYVFKARVLSKSWLAKMSPVSSQVDDETKQCATVFQKQIMERSINWKTFCLFYFGTMEGSSHAYDPTTGRWSRFPSLSFLPHSIRDFTLRDSSSFATAEQIEGSLLLWSTSSEGNKGLYMANMLTRTWKALPRRPYANVNGKTILVHMTEKYQVIDLLDIRSQAGSEGILQIFDSTVAAWTCITFPRSLMSYPVDLERIAYLDGVLYVVSINHQLYASLGVRALKANTVTLEEQFSMVITTPLRKYSTVHAVIFDARYLILIAFGVEDEIQVVKVDLTSQNRVVFSGPFKTGMLDRTQRRVVSDGQWIFIYMERGYDPLLVHNRALAYNVHEDEWHWVNYICMNPIQLWEYQQQMEESSYRSSFHWIRGSFRPGLNPFAEV